MNLAHLSRRGYVTTATPIEFLPNFTKSLDANINVYIKRDDLLPGTSGGNKTRKLDFIMADALAQGADTIITCGAIQSNHCRLTLSWAVKEGLDCHLILEEHAPNGYKPEALGNNFLYKLLGVKSITVVEFGTDKMHAMVAKASELSALGKNPYIIPVGASNALGAVGYVSCAEECMHQFFEMSLNIDNIVLPSGSTGTHAGMLAGIVGNNVNIPITGISVGRNKDAQEKAVHILANQTLELIGTKTNVPMDSVVVFDDYVGAGYSLTTDDMIKAVKMLARTEGILLDPVYSGKTMAGLIDLARNNYFAPKANVLFLHTGGSPALYAYASEFDD